MAKKKSRPPARRTEPPRRREPGATPVPHSDGGSQQPATALQDGHPRTESFPIAGVGASAGGLEAFTELLRGLPASPGLALVLVQHLAPKHRSMLTELLSSATSLPVTEVTEGMHVAPDHIYVIPPNTRMGIERGVLHLIPRSEDGGQHMPIDWFLRSLAADQQGRAIGVILAGTASDGANGLRAIKAEGGITLAQDPATVRYDGMPRAAIAAGVVDFVLPVEAIANELAKIGRHPYVRLAPEPPELPGADDQMHRVFRLLRAASGVDFTYYKHATIQRRIRRRMVLQKVDRLPDYVRLLEQQPAEVEALYQDMLIHVTGFFRDPESFDAIQELVVPQLVEHRGQASPIRVWVPGCSTGEEVYSLAITLIEALRGTAHASQIQIFASDISTSAVDRARAGFYPESIAADVSAERLRRFFVRADGGFRISKSVRDMCVFARQDVTRDPPFSRLDLISCRNLLIYLGSVLQKRVLSTFHYALNSGGFLVLGGSETTGSSIDLFATVAKRHKIYQRRSAERVNMEFRSESRPERHEPARLPVSQSPHGDFQREIERLIMARFAPAAVAITPDLQVVHISGQTGRYLQPAPGEASLHLLKMAREGLMLELRTAIHTARKTNAPVRKERVHVRQNGHEVDVDLDVVPIQVVPGERHLLVLFRDSTPIPPGIGRQAGAGSRRLRDPERTRLLEELHATREYLQSIIQDQEATNEELQSANEEILSSNEELQSANEELETAKEELQSTNEELNTVNDELQTRNHDLSQVNSDLTNLLASVQIPIIMVSNDLRIRRFTPMIERIFNVIPSDMGRPIGDFKSNLNLPHLEQLIAETIDTVSVRELEAQDLQGRWYSIRIRPYKGVDNRIDGAVVTLHDIDAIKRSVSLNMVSDHLLTAIAEITRDPLAVLDATHRLQTASGAFYRAFRISPQEARDRSIFEVGRGQWDEARLRILLGELLLRGRRVEDFEITTALGPGQTGWSVNAIAIGEPEMASRVVLLGFAALSGPRPERN